MPDSRVDSEEDPYRRRELKRWEARERRHREREERERQEKMARKEDIPAPTKATSPKSAPDVSTPDCAAAPPVAAEAPAAVPVSASVPVPVPDLTAAAPARQLSPRRRPWQPQLRSTGRIPRRPQFSGMDLRPWLSRPQFSGMDLRPWLSGPQFSGMDLRPWLSGPQLPEMLLTLWLLRPRPPGMVLCRRTLSPRPRPLPRWGTQIRRHLGLPRTSLSPLLTPDPASPLFTCRSSWSARQQLNGFREENWWRSPL